MGQPSRDEVNCALARDVLRKHELLQFRALGISMVPTLWPGELLIVRAAIMNDVNPGDMVLFSRGNSLCAHRVLSKTGSTLVTRGDALRNADPPVTSAELLGRVVFVRRKDTDVPLRSESNFAMRTLAWILSRSQLLMALAIRCHSLMNRFRNTEQAQTQQVELS